MCRRRLGPLWDASIATAAAAAHDGVAIAQPLSVVFHKYQLAILHVSLRGLL